MNNLTQNLTEKNLADFFNKLRPLLSADITAQPDSIIEFTAEKYQHFFSGFNEHYQSDVTRGVEINVWQQAGLKRDEVRNTSVLSWWLDEQGNHGLGSVLFKTFIMAINQANPNKTPLCCEGAYATYVESLPLAERENRIDVEIVGKRFLLFIEVKINASEGEQQLARYLSLLNDKTKHRGIAKEKSAVIYLTAYKNTPEVDPAIYCISWQQVADAFNNLKLPPTAVFTQSLLKQFCQHIEQF